MSQKMHAGVSSVMGQVLLSKALTCMLAGTKHEGGHLSCLFSFCLFAEMSHGL